MSEEAMSPESRQRLAELRADLAVEREAHETIIRLEVNLEDVQELAGGYVNRKVQAMAAYVLDTEDRYVRLAMRPIKTPKRKTR
jgi:hypothetical protein